MSSNLAFQDEPWNELIAGKLSYAIAHPCLNHCYISSNIYLIFRNYQKNSSINKADYVLSHASDLYLTPNDRFVPDVMVVCDRSKIKANGVHGAPDLVVEVLSPSTAKNDRKHKKEVYAACGVREYWLVNPADKTVEQYFLEDNDLVLQEVYAIHPDYMLEKMTEEQRAAIPTSFKCSLYDDLLIQLTDVFENVD